MKLEVGKVYTFFTRAPALLNDRIERVRVSSIMDFDTAETKQPVGVKYRQVYPMLPEGTPDDPRAAVWYGLRTEAGDELIFSEQWIDLDSVLLIESIDLDIRIRDVNTSDVETLRKHLLAMGYEDFDITVR